MNGADAESANAFSISEFARLAVILCYDEDVRMCFLESLRCLSRAQLDARESGDAFWHDTVAERFNDRTNAPAFSFLGVCDGVNSRALSLCKRAGDELRRQCLDVCPFFTISHARWSQSGQNETSNFYAFYPKDKRIQGLSILGKNA